MTASNIITEKEQTSENGTHLKKKQKQISFKIHLVSLQFYQQYQTNKDFYYNIELGLYIYNNGYTYSSLKIIFR